MKKEKRKIAIYQNLPPGGVQKTIYEFSKKLSKKFILELYTTSEENKKIFSVGNLSPHKGHKFIIDVLSLVNSDIKPELFISSGGVNLENENYLRNYGLSKNVKVKIIPFVSQDEVSKLYNEALITVCVAHLETLGLFVLESMACGTPVIAVKEGGYRNMIVNGINGFLVNRKPGEFAMTIEKILKNYKMTKKITLKARKMLYSYWTWNGAVKRLEFFINKFFA